MTDYPLEICCPHCHEVFALLERPIPVHEKLKNTLNYLDTPMIDTNYIGYCPLCDKLIENGTRFIHADMNIGIGRLIFEAMERVES